jgi:signal transduction histidine kinase
MAGVKRVTDAAQAVEAGRLKQSVQSHHEGCEIEALADAFNSMTHRIDGLVKEIRDVTANVAHDLRTPLTRIRTIMETADWSRAPETERHEAAAQVIEECDQLAPLINDILELCQAETGMLALRPERFDFAAETRKALELFSILAEEKSISIENGVPESAIPITADRTRIQRILANLIDNAVKYTPEGGRFSVRLREEHGMALLEVADNGPGIPFAERDRVFERFHRLDASRTAPGNGLGLSLAKAFAVAQGGDVELSETIPHGCTVTLRLPAEAKPGE